MSDHTSAFIRSRNASRRALMPARCVGALLTLAALAISPVAHASLFSGDTLDTVANVLAWIVLFIAPAIAIAVFWMVHILPERIAEKNHHPQAHAIKTLCLLSLFFGGLLWPLAWLWAYTKPVLHKLAYGTDRVVHAADETATAEPPAEEVVEETVADDDPSHPLTPPRRIRATH